MAAQQTTRVGTILQQSDAGDPDARLRPKTSHPRKTARAWQRSLFVTSHLQFLAMGAFSSGFGVRRLDPQEPEDRCCLWLESVAGLGKAGCVSIAKYLQPSSGVVRGAPERNQ